MDMRKKILAILMSVLFLAVLIADTVDISDNNSAPIAACYVSVVSLFIIITNEERRRTVRRIQNRKKRGRTSTMRQLIERFIGKEVSVASILGTLRGVLTELSENAVLIECKGNVQVINVDYIYSVKEVKPKKK